MTGQIGFWAAFADERGVSHYAFTTDPAYADLSPENAVSRTGAIVAFTRAIERYRAILNGSPPRQVSHAGLWWCAAAPGDAQRVPSAMKARPSLDQVAVAKLRMRHTARSPSSSYPTESGARGAVPGAMASGLPPVYESPVQSAGYTH